MVTHQDNLLWKTVETAIKASDSVRLADLVNSLSHDDINLLMSHLDEENRIKLLELMPPIQSARVIKEIQEVQALKLLGPMDSEKAAMILNELKSNYQADFIGELDQASAEAIMAEMEKDDAEHVRNLMEFDPDTAGGLMVTEFLAFEADLTVSDVIDYMRDHVEDYAGYHVQYLYVVEKKKFIGVLATRDLLFTPPQTLLTEIVIQDALTVRDNTPFEELTNFFDTHDFYGVPVLNQEGEIVGVVLRKFIKKEELEILGKEFLEVQGIVGGEELRTLPVLTRSRRRLSWLSVNILLNIIAASVIAMYQDTLSAAIALAVFLPIISDMSGCSGNQAVAVSLRELSLGVVKTFDVTRVWLQEISVGLINGIVLGSLLGLAAFLWKGSALLGIVVGVALGLNTMVAVSIGGTIPLILRKMNVDPALASGPILTTITDMIGFLLTLSLAAWVLSEYGMI